MIPQLEAELQSLSQNGMEVEAREADGQICVVLKNYALPTGYNKKQTRLLLKIPLSYPNGKPDMFWVEPDVKLISGVAQASTSVETALGEQWLRFSWHPQSWNPARDNIVAFLEFVNRRLVQLK